MKEKKDVKRTMRLKEKNSTFQRNSMGFSLAEVLVTLAIMGILSLGVAHFLTFSQKSYLREAQTSENLRNINMNYSYIISRLQNIQHSFGNMKQQDDNNLSFFDYYPDYHKAFLPANRQSRKLTLSVNKPQSEQTILFLKGGEEAGRLKAIALFHYDDDARLFHKPPTYKVQFNQHNELEKLVKKVESSWWTDHQLLLFYVPVFMRNQTTGQGDQKTIDMKSPPKNPSFLGKVLGRNFKRFYQKNNVNIFKFYIPIPSLAAGKKVYKNFEDFIKRSPFMGTGEDLFLFTPVTLGVFKFKKVNENYGELYYCEGDARLGENLSSCGTDRARNFKSLLLMDQLKEVVFKRDNVSNGIIDVELVPFKML